MLAAAAGERLRCDLTRTLSLSGGEGEGTRLKHEKLAQAETSKVFG